MQNFSYICSKINSFDIKKFVITINGIHGFPDDRHIRILYFSIDSAYMDNVYNEITSKINLKKGTFNPHITIYRFKSFHKIIKNDVKFDIAIDRICLYKSIFNEKRIYNELCCKCI